MADSLKMYWSEKTIAACDYITARYSKIIVYLRFDRVWLIAVTIAGHAAFCLESMANAYTEPRLSKDGWVLYSRN